MKSPLLLTLAVTCAWALTTAQAAAKAVAREIDITIDFAAPGEPAKVGEHNIMRAIYDDARIDPSTKRARLLNLQHPVPEGFAPRVPDASEMPMSDAWIDLSGKPLRVHFQALVVHGKSIFISLDERERRFTLRADSATGTVLMSGSYVVSERTLSGAEIDAAAGLSPKK